MSETNNESKYRDDLLGRMREINTEPLVKELTEIADEISKLKSKRNDEEQKLQQGIVSVTNYNANIASLNFQLNQKSYEEGAINIEIEMRTNYKKRLKLLYSYYMKLDTSEDFFNLVKLETILFLKLAINHIRQKNNSNNANSSNSPLNIGNSSDYISKIDLPSSKKSDIEQQINKIQDLTCSKSFDLGDYPYEVLIGIGAEKLFDKICKKGLSK